MLYRFPNHDKFLLGHMGTFNIPLVTSLYGAVNVPTEADFPLLTGDNMSQTHRPWVAIYKTELAAPICCTNGWPLHIMWARKTIWSRMFFATVWPLLDVYTGNGCLYVTQYGCIESFKTLYSHIENFMFMYRLFNMAKLWLWEFPMGDNSERGIKPHSNP